MKQRFVMFYSVSICSASRIPVGELLAVTVFIMSKSITVRKSRCDKMQPWQTPEMILKNSVVAVFVLMQYEEFLYIGLIHIHNIYIYYIGMPYNLSMFEKW